MCVCVCGGVCVDRADVYACVEAFARQEEIQRKGDINAKSHEMRLELLYLELDKYHDAVHGPGRIRTTAVSAL